MNYKIIFDKKTCIAAGNCELANAANWKVNRAEGKASVKKTAISDAELSPNLEAARSCPTNSIKIINMDTGEEVK